jgi:acyl-coenzyme A synthetase/AMP-(fatty) acid ligase
MVTADELIAFVATQPAAYKTPGEIFFLDDLPKSATGKILRRALWESRIQAHRNGADSI